MPLLGLNDLAAAGKLAWQIKTVGSSKYTNAQQEFTEFLADVNTLARTLDAVQEAAKPSGPGSNALDLSSAFVQSFISEAKETLTSCKKLIEHNPHFKKDNGGYVTNILWALTIAEHVEKQQIRIQVCFQKANFVIQQRADGAIQRNQELALEDSRADNEETHRLLRGLYGRQGNIPGTGPDATALLSARITDRFEQSLSILPPEERPTVAQRFDAVVTFYDRSTHSFEPQEPFILSPSPIQYLNLLKCIWLLQSIQADQALVKYYENPFSAAWARRLARKVRGQAIRFLEGASGIRPVNEDDLLQLGETDFWVDPRQTKSDPTPGPLEANGNEVLLMRRTLKSRNQTTVEEILVFRVAESRLRLTKALSTQGHAQRAEREIVSTELDCRKAYLNPVYALSSTAVPSIIWKGTSSDQSGQELALNNLTDALKFQAYVTNFRVACDEPGVAGVRKKTGVFDGQGRAIGEAGRAQIWTYENPFLSNSQNQGTSSDSRFGQSSPNPSTGRSSGMWTESAMRSINPSSTVRSGDGGAFLTEPVRPQLILLTEVAGVKRLISIHLDEYTQLAPDKCHCSRKNSQCREIIVERTDKKINVRTALTKAHSDGWNIAIFGEPRHEEVATVDEDNVKYVSIHFNSLEARQRFEESLNIACRSIRSKVNAYHQDLKHIRRIAIVKT
ncbi:hypothetical protein H2198_008318 [Neophaeococcomyces mojaviensis]|uniref:Uncharacterized protein n=1 Tax=Neophaeococcomyces mojaviensis TaxID=3383035 RepID=A0ACC2ZXU4_9EURO|nr:hypothetical protein H2198_008318 [Knufia sp. JES_112]